MHPQGHGGPPGQGIPMVPMGQFAPHGQYPGAQPNPYAVQGGPPPPGHYPQGIQMQQPAPGNVNPYAGAAAAGAAPHGGPVSDVVPDIHRTNTVVFGAIKRGYPDAPWKCNACTYLNVADRMFCAICEIERPPLNVGELNHQAKADAFFLGGRDINFMPKEDGKSADGAAAAPAASAVTADKDNDGLDDRFTQKHKDQMRVLCMSQDQFNKVLASGLAMYEIFKSVMATLLSIFVPQYCKPDLTHPSTSRHVGHDCTIEENFEELTQFNLFVVVWNFISLFFCMATYFFVYRRETIFNDLLDEDPTVTNDNLVRKSGEGNPCVLDLYPTISYTIRKRNTMVYFTAAFTMLILIVNIVTSGILVFYYYYTGFRTVTVFITNVTLILNILMTQARLAKRGLESGVVYSMYKSDPAVFNQIDRHLIGKPPYFQPQARGNVAARRVDNVDVR